MNPRTGFDFFCKFFFYLSKRFHEFYDHIRAVSGKSSFPAYLNNSTNWERRPGIISATALKKNSPHCFIRSLSSSGVPKSTLAASPAPSILASPPHPGTRIHWLSPHPVAPPERWGQESAPFAPACASPNEQGRSYWSGNSRWESSVFVNVVSESAFRK